MNGCHVHWMMLRAAIDERGLMHLVADDGPAAARRMASEFEEGRSAKNYDPLMGAWFAILSNAMETIKAAGGNPLYSMASPDVPETPVDKDQIARAGLPEDATWPRCVVCYLNLAHRITCRDERCTLDRERGYDWMIDRAADDALQKATELGLVAS